MLPSLWFLLFYQGLQEAQANRQRYADAPALAARIDRLTEKHWETNKLKPSPLVDDAAFLRRITLDLAGRIPTYHEAVTFAKEPASDKRTQAIRRLLASPEYALQIGRLLDQLIQEKYAGDSEFLEYLRGAVAAHESWEQIFRDIMLGPWDAKGRQRADRFLRKRLKSLDDLTNDTARIFFGVNVSCAKCHDHPLVPDWTQDHYYGMVSFFFRTAEAAKGKNAAVISEKPAGDVTYVSVKGEKRTAKLMFLSSQLVEEPTGKDKKAPPSSRRELLVKTALQERSFFSKAIVNRLWSQFMGRGLVQPADQMHSANPPSIPGLLQELADDLAAHRYDLDRLVGGLVSSRVYQLASTAVDEDAKDKDFTHALLRPLTPQQYALSILLAVGDEEFDLTTAADVRARRYRALEGESGRLTRFDLLDQRTDRFQSSAGEALFMSNHPEVQRLLAPSGKNLAARLTGMTDTRQLVEQAVWTILSRPPESDELAHLARWFDSQTQDRGRRASELIWALLASAEFRFNH
jgi:hypothetical protein